MAPVKSRPEVWENLKPDRYSFAKNDTQAPKWHGYKTPVSRSSDRYRFWAKMASDKPCPEVSATRFRSKNGTR